MFSYVHLVDIHYVLCVMFVMINLPDFSGNLYGYARVSTEEQNLNLQLDALRAAGIPDNRIFKDKVSGTAKVKPGLARVRNVMRAGDCLAVWRLDRVGRGMVSTVAFVEKLASDDIRFRSLCEPMIDTTSPSGRMLLGLMAVLAQHERDMISARTKEGIKAAKSRGVQFGRKHSILDCPARFKRFVAMWKAGDIPDGVLSARQITDELNAVKSKLPAIKSHTSYQNWKGQGFPGFDQKAMERV